MKKILVLGGDGMLGYDVYKTLQQNKEFDVLRSVRDKNLIDDKTFFYDCQNTKIGAEDVQWVINCIGKVKPTINENDKETCFDAIFVNSFFPHFLTKFFPKAKIIQIATDCVFGGNKDHYDENSPHDPIDVYGKTKSLGEIKWPNFYNLRCSVIGKEYRDKSRSLLEWFLRQEKGAKLNGFTDHKWNGITTLHFAKIVRGIIENDISPNQTQHILPSDVVNKYELLKIFAEAFDRDDLEINSHDSGNSVNRILSTLRSEENKNLWKAAGYNIIPSVRDMVLEYSNYIK